MKKWKHLYTRAISAAVALAMICSTATGFASAKETAGPPQEVTPPEERVLDYDSMTDPALPLAKKQAKKLYVIQPGSFDDMVTAGTVQGLMANQSEENIYIMANPTYQLWLDQIKKDYGVATENVAGIWSALPKFTSKIDGYILCRTTYGDAPDSGIYNANMDESVNVANTLCSQLNAIAVTEANEQKAKDAGLKMVLDVRDWDEEALRAKPEYYDKLDKNLAIELWQMFGANLRDYAVMSNAMVFFSQHQEGHRTMFLEDLNDNFALFGWGDPAWGEMNFVAEVSRLNGYTVPSDHSYNLSVLSGYRTERVEQKTEEPSGEVKNKHTVCFMMTDGDNIQWNLNAFATDERWYGYPSRGSFNMGWGIPATMIDLAPSAVKKIYDMMTPQDGFITQISGLGYMYPSMMTRDNLEKHAAMLNDYMGRADTNILEVIDFDQLYNQDQWDIFMKQPNIDGAFYIDGRNYSYMEGAINWASGKPIISSRYNLWSFEDGGYLEPGGGVNELTTLFSRVGTENSVLTTDPTDESGYSLVLVHCWSHTMSDIQKIISRMDKDKIDVVTPQEFLARVQKNGAGQPPTGWQEIDGKWYYYDQYSQPVMGWQTIDGKRYYFDIFGERQSGWLDDSGYTYYLNADGIMQTGWQTISGKRYYFDANGRMLTGWQTVGSTRYYFKSSGEMGTGFVAVGKDWYLFNSSGQPVSGWQYVGKRWYYLNADGKMRTGWQWIGGKWYFLGSDGKMRTGWYQDGKTWYFSEGSGVMATGWKKIGSKWYYLGSNGKMRTGWYKVGSKWYYSNSSGVMQTGWYRVGSKWYFSEGSGAMATGWKKTGGKWYYLGSDGKMRTGWYKVGSKWYYSNGSGVMQTGWKKIGAKWYFFESGGKMVASTSRRIGKKTYRFNSRGICLNP